MGLEHQGDPFLDELLDAAVFDRGDDAELTRRDGAERRRVRAARHDPGDARPVPPGCPLRRPAQSADLSGANLTRTNLEGADLTGA